MHNGQTRSLCATVVFDKTKNPFDPAPRSSSRKARLGLVHHGDPGPARARNERTAPNAHRFSPESFAAFVFLVGRAGAKMVPLSIALALLIQLSLSVLPVSSQQCQLVRAGAHSDPQPSDPSIPSPSISSITNTSSTSGVLPTSTTQPQPTSTPFVYGRDKIRGVNLCVVSPLQVFPTISDPHVPLRGGWFVLEVRSSFTPGFCSERLTRQHPAVDNAQHLPKYGKR